MTEGWKSGVDGESHEGLRRSFDSHRSGVTSVTSNSKFLSDRSSPSDQLVAAILDGDVQGIRAIVRSKGDTLQSPYWIEISKSTLPLHRAISGLHVHGNDSRLVGTLDALIQLGANVRAVDHVGNTAVHKSLQVNLFLTFYILSSANLAIVYRFAHPLVSTLSLKPY